MVFSRFTCAVLHIFLVFIQDDLNLMDHVFSAADEYIVFVILNGGFIIFVLFLACINKKFAIYVSSYLYF